MKISVLVTSYNYEQYIEQTITSLITQTVPIHEIVIVDDGSKDSSPAIIAQFAEQNNNIKFIQHKDFGNHGLPASISRGLEFVTGDYLAFCESDDYWDKKHYEKLINYIEQNPQSSFIVNQTKVLDTSYKNYNEYINSLMTLLANRNAKPIFNIVRDCNPIPTFSSVTVKTAVIRKCNFATPLPQYIDFWLWRQILFHEKCFYCEEAITFWRRHPLSYDYRENVTNLEKFISASDNLIQVPKYIHCLGYIKRMLKSWKRKIPPPIQ